MKHTESPPIQDIAKQFAIPEKQFSCHPYGSGHINDTYLIQSLGEVETRYLLQRINHHVFKDVPALMQNMGKVTSHLQEKLQTADKFSRHFTTITLLPTHSGKLYFQDQAGQYWRMQHFVPHSISYDVVTTAAQAYQAGKAFGTFQALLKDLPADGLQQTIPDFHNMESRLRQFQQACDADPAGRKGQIAEEIAFVEKRKPAMSALYQQVKEGAIPLRITHNDTKFNNVLLEETTHEALCVIDLDTVMPGVVLYDFGDAVRSIVNTGAEDESRQEKIQVNLSFYEAFAEGYLTETLSFLTAKEIERLAFSAQYMTFIMGLRFLTDHLAGDVYYKIRHQGHNLQRARAQFTLLTRMEDLYEPMKAIIHQRSQHKGD